MEIVLTDTQIKILKAGREEFLDIRVKRKVIYIPRFMKKWWIHHIFYDQKLKKQLEFYG